jgi:hypothetical protein
MNYVWWCTKGQVHKEVKPLLVAELCLHITAAEIMDDRLLSNWATLENSN